jgi:hypothetical protein
MSKRSPSPYAAILPLLERDRKHIKRGLKLPFHGISASAGTERGQPLADRAACRTRYGGATL